MKKFFYSIFAATTMLFATTSCSQEEEIVNGGSDAKTQKVSFKVEMPGEATSRAIEDGVEVGQANKANKLAWALYEVNKESGEPLDTGVAEKQAGSKEFSVNIDMVKGLQYKVLFLAYNEDGTIFDVTAGDDLKSLNYKSTVVSNKEAYDAFVACHTHTVNDEAVTTVKLYRPFAQINAATTGSDLTKAAKLGATVTASQLVIEGVPTQYNVLTGEVSEYKDVIYTKDAILYQAGTTDNEIIEVGGENYHYLNMVYVLAGEGTSTSSTHDAKFTFYRDAEPQLVRTIDVVNLPIQRNYRTNVIGDLITQTEAFKIVIDAEFDIPSFDENGFKVAYNKEDLATAIANAEDGVNTVIKLGGDVTIPSGETLFIPAGKKITIDMAGSNLSIENVENEYAIINHGELTLKDSSVASRSTEESGYSARGIYNGYDKDGNHNAQAKIIIESGTYNAKGTNGGAVIFNYGIAEIKGGTLTSVGGYTLNNQSGSSMTVSSGVTANNGIYCTGATLVVDGGEIKGNRSGCHVVYAYNSNITINGGDFYNNNSGNSTIMSAGNTVTTINGGIFGIKDGRVPGNGNTWTSCLTDTQNSAKMTINNGAFNGGFRVQAGTTMVINAGSFNDCTGSSYNIYGTVAVKGGIYTDATAINFAKKYVSEGYKVKENGNGTCIVVDASIIEVTPENISSIDFNAKGKYTYKLVGDFSGFTNINITPTEGVEAVIDASDATFGNQIKVQIPSVPDNANQVSRELGRKGTYTLKGFKNTALGIGAYGTNITVTESDLKVIDVYAANISIDINGNKINSNYQMQPRVSGGETDYAACLMMMSYDLKFDNNEAANAIGHVVAINGLVATYDADRSEVDNPNWSSNVVSFTGNTMSGIGGSTKTERAGFKVWDDLTYAPNGGLADFNALPEAGQNLKLYIESAESNNTFIKAAGATTNPYKFSFYNLNLETL